MSRTEVGAKKSRWVSKKPTDMNQGCVAGASRSASIVSGATYSARLESTGTTSS